MLCGPSLDFGSEPQLHAASAELDDRPGHVVIAALVQADAVSVGEAQEVGDAVGVGQILRMHERGHDKKSTSVDGSVRDLR
jgi:hypothetical protein